MLLCNVSFPCKSMSGGKFTLTWAKPSPFAAIHCYVVRSWGGTPASSGLLLHTARGPRAARPLAPPPWPLVSPAKEILDGRERRRRFLFVGSFTQWLRCLSQFVNLPLARADSWGPTARSENGKPRAADSLSCSAGASTWPLGRLHLSGWDAQRALKMTVSLCLMQAGTTPATKETAEEKPTARRSQKWPLGISCSSPGPPGS